MFTLILSPSDLSTNIIHSYCLSKNIKYNCQPTNEPTSSIKLNNSTLQGTNSLALHLAKYSKPELFSDDVETSEIQHWLSISETTKEPQELAKVLDEHLLTRTYLVAERLTVTDLAVFARVHSAFSTLTDAQRFERPALTRWFDLIQHSIPDVDGLSKVKIDLAAPKVEKNVETKNKEAKFVKKAEGKENMEVKEDVANKQAAKEDKKSAKKGEKKKKEAPAEVPPPPGAVNGCVPSQLDLRVGKILHCEKHPDADSLYIEKIEVGEEEPRIVVSGLVHHIPIEQMKDREVIIMANLKPVAMRGVKSMAMVMCTTTAEGIVDILPPPKGSKPGDRVYFEGYEELKPETQLNPKKKIFETLSPTLKTDESGKAGWIDADGKPHLMRTKHGVCENPAAVDSLIK